ncbi:MAG: hypothetical protein JOZ46_05710 [Candidatus Dormibacteraeota bacterium]|nr:hypothetical protein [Candidatus Dormibacteraeota bacterium]MBV9525294.1 hypothetical protein [Candidatus Dormibacteraeota bacterium]
MKHATPPAPLTDEEVSGWFAGRLPDNLYASAPDISADRDEILVVGPIAEPEIPADATEGTRTAARSARIARFRSETRDARIRVARDAERLFGRKVSWGARIGDVEELFTTLGVPVMTRLRMEDRRVLDTLIDAGVARSRSEALAWSVRLVGKHQSEWIASLRDALSNVEKVRATGPDVV